MNIEEKICVKCLSDVMVGDKFCRHCGQPDPASGFTWDWKEQPLWGEINALLRPFGCRLEEVNTNSDQYAMKVVAYSK